jgi:hypothetical protein
MIITFYGLNLSFMYLPYTTTKMHNKMIPTQIQYSLYISLQFQGEIKIAWFSCPIQWIDCGRSFS